jgi:hypothetical protein
VFSQVFTLVCPHGLKILKSRKEEVFVKTAAGVLSANEIFGGVAEKGTQCHD